MSKRVVKFVFILFLLIIGFAFTLTSFNMFNDEKVVSANQLNLNNKEEIVLNQLVTNDSSKRLVPVGTILGVDDINEVVMEYEVLVNKNDVELIVQVDNVLIGNEDSYSHLINIEISQEHLDDKYLVKAIISLNMPANETEYNAIANKQITFSLVFSVRGD